MEQTQRSENQGGVAVLACGHRVDNLRENCRTCQARFELVEQGREANTAELDHLVNAVEKTMRGGGLTSTWTSSLAEAIASLGTGMSAKASEILGRHSWNGKQFEGPPDRTRLLTDLLRASSNAQAGAAAHAVETEAAERPAPALALPGARKDNAWRIPSHYQVMDKIGSGAYGEVREAVDRRQNELVAIKQIRHLFEDLVDCKRILREISILSKLKHDCIVEIYDVIAPGDVQTFDELYIVMEICDSDMKKLVRSDATLKPEHVQTLLYNLLVGLQYLHTAGIYHRDLKPANCLVNADCSVKICDFGLSRAVFEEQQLLQAVPSAPTGQSQGGVPPIPGGLQRQLTRHVVTRWYRAPELILMQEGYTGAIDVWSVGCIYAELLGMLEGTRKEDRGPLFPGAHCFPLSPDHRHQRDYRHHTQSGRDQLSRIFRILGTPSEADLGRIERDDARRYVACFARQTGTGLRSKFPHVDGDAMDLLEQMLRFNDDERITVAAALDHPLFDEVRDPAKERLAGTTISLDFEREQELGEGQLRKYFFDEIKKRVPKSSAAGV